jgi:AraC family transcriptional regulator
MDARVRSAQRLMIDDLSTSLAEVAALTGFSDQSHFSRAFQEIVGLTPTAWLHQRP